MSSVSGLSMPKRIRARDLAVEAALLGVKHAPAIHYTQLGARWEGIAEGHKAWRGEFPKNADCSSFATWCLWNGLDHYGIRDTVNDQRWKAGFTGSMAGHGRRVSGPDAALRGDLILYGNPTGGDAHVTLVVGRDQGGRLMVVSHGSEAARSTCGSTTAPISPASPLRLTLPGRAHPRAHTRGVCATWDCAPARARRPGR